MVVRPTTVLIGLAIGLMATTVSALAGASRDADEGP